MSKPVIVEAGIVLRSQSATAEDAILECGKLLVELGAVQPEYLAAMFEREQTMTCAIGSGIAIPHGTETARDFVNFDQLVLLQPQAPINWSGQEVQLVVGIASRTNTHVDLLGQIAGLVSGNGMQRLVQAKTKSEILQLITQQK